ncbi:hypothetical protein [Streptomyces sp. cg35]|uniref:hypothetical protein n=1 Tax=Streptomyces sp. cg35 TaxID=3421650 RepID=UPI003D17133F
MEDVIELTRRALLAAPVVIAVGLAAGKRPTPSCLADIAMDPTQWRARPRGDLRYEPPDEELPGVEH